MKKNPDKKMTVVKLNAGGHEVWRYSGNLLREEAHSRLLEAFFNREDMELFGLTLQKGDRFIEMFYSDRWYNLLEVYSSQTGEFKGWYCNITSPAQFQDSLIIYRDLALDLLVFPDGTVLVLDEDEFAALELSSFERSKALETLQTLKELFLKRPFLRLVNLIS